jgi:hypothetical protein
MYVYLRGSCKALASLMCTYSLTTSKRLGFTPGRAPPAFLRSAAPATGRGLNCIKVPCGHSSMCSMAQYTALHEGAFTQHKR